MTQTVYLAGYQSMKLDQLAAFMAEHGADLMDIRHSPWSPNPQYTKGSMQKRFGEHYAHLPELGNKLYRTGGMEFVDMDEGARLIAAHPRPVILLCACADAASCHRTAAGRELARRGFTVEEISPRPKEFVQGGLL